MGFLTIGDNADTLAPGASVNEITKSDRLDKLLSFIQGDNYLNEQETASLKPHLWKLQEEWMYLWHRTKERGLISEILSLAHRFQSLGRETELSLLVIYGQELEERTMSFDLEGFEMILKLYPPFVEALAGGQR